MLQTIGLILAVATVGTLACENATLPDGSYCPESGLKVTNILLFLKWSEGGRRPTEQSVFNSLVLFWSCELYSELQNRNKGTNNTLCKLRKLSKLKGDIWKRRKKDRVELQPFSKREFESSKGRNEKGEIKSFLCQKVGRWNSMLRSLSFHEYYILHHQSL